MNRWAVWLAVLGCKGARDNDQPAPPSAPAGVTGEPRSGASPVDGGDATPAPPPNSDAQLVSGWPQLAGYPLCDAVRTIALPVDVATPRFDVAGPVIASDVAVVTSSQFGAIALNWRSGAIVWRKPTGLHVAPPTLLADGNLALIGDCPTPPEVPPDESLLGCARVVTPGGIELSYVAIHGRRQPLAPFVAARGRQATWAIDDAHRIRWQRGDRAIELDALTGAAKPTAIGAPPIAIRYEDRQWDITHVDGRIVATGKAPWSTKNSYSALIGPVWLPEMSPMIRIANAGAFRDSPEIHVIDIDATGSLRAQVAKPAPGIAVVGWSASPVGDAALAVRVDNSLTRDAIVGYTANAILLWVFPLPEVKRVDPIGVGWASDAVVVFHDGDTVTVLPELSAPPTTPGAPASSLRIPTP